MARVITLSGPRISAFPDARPFTDRQFVQRQGDRGYNADTRERGDFLSVRVEIPHLAETTLPERVFWIPVSDAHCVYYEDEPDGGRFEVFAGPKDPHVAQWFLSGLTEAEKRDLLSDLKKS